MEKLYVIRNSYLYMCAIVTVMIKKNVYIFQFSV